MGVGFLSYMVVRTKKITLIQAAFKKLMVYLKKIYTNITNIREEGVAITCYKIYIYYSCNPDSIVTTLKVLIMVYFFVKNLIIIFDPESLSINTENPGNKRENSEELGGQRKMVRLSGLPDLGLSENAVVNTEL
jgi:hypothetical protein